MPCFVRVCAPSLPQYIVVPLSLSHLHAHNPRPRLPSTNTHDHARRIGARAAVSTLVNFRQNDPPRRRTCPKSAVKHFHFCRSLRFYHLSSELALFLAVCISYCPLFCRIPPLSPGQSRRRKSVLSFRFGSIPAGFFRFFAVAIAIFLSLFEIGTESVCVRERYPPPDTATPNPYEPS